VATQLHLTNISSISLSSSASSLKARAKAFTKDVGCESVEWIYLAQDQIMLLTSLTHLWVKYPV
jgi:hypothetical protein